MQMESARHTITSRVTHVTLRIVFFSLICRTYDTDAEALQVAAPAFMLHNHSRFCCCCCCYCRFVLLPFFSGFYDTLRSTLTSFSATCSRLYNSRALSTCGLWQRTGCPSERKDKKGLENERSPRASRRFSFID